MPPASGSPRFDARRLVALGRVSAAVPSPCGTWLAVAVARVEPTRGRYVSDLWRVPLDRASPPVQLTRGASDDRCPAFRRDGALGFLSNREPTGGANGGGERDEERAQVWLLPREGGEPVPLTDEPLGVAAFRFAPAGDRLVVVADVLPGVAHEAQRATAAELRARGPSALRYDRMPVRFWDRWLPRAAPHLVAYDEEGRGRRDLTPGADREYRGTEWDVAPDGACVVATAVAPAHDRIEEHALVLIDAAAGEARTLARWPRTQLSAPRFAPDKRRVACVRHQRVDGAHGRPHLVVLEADTGAARALAEDWDRWPRLSAWTRDGAHLLVTADDDGMVPVFRVDARSGAVARITSRADGGCHEEIAPAPGGDAVVGVRHRLLQPPEPFRVALEPDAQPELIARLSGFDEADGRQLARWTSREVTVDDGARVQYFLLEPASRTERAAPRPTLLWIHGGPLGQWADGWHWRWNPLVAVARGYAVALPNPRGSTGFGQPFVEGIWNNTWGERCYRDVLAVADALAREPACDGGRMAAMGGSFGGYMTNWIGVNTDRFRCLVTHAGLFALSSFYAVTDRPAWWTHAFGATPWQDPDGFDRYSPHRRVAAWKSPTLIIHGERDFRVPVGEALALFEALQVHGVPSELLVFPDEHHWICRPANVVAWYDAVLAFLHRHLEA